MVKLFVISAVIAIFASSNGANGSNSTDLEGIARLLRGDVRVIAMGDSYSTSYWGRVATAGLRVWPIPHISAIGGGTGYGNNILRSVDYCVRFHLFSPLIRLDIPLSAKANHNNFLPYH
jgi:hypothetical protein